LSKRAGHVVHVFINSKCVHNPLNQGWKTIGTGTNFGTEMLHGTHDYPFVHISILDPFDNSIIPLRQSIFAICSSVHIVTRLHARRLGVGARFPAWARLSYLYCPELHLGPPSLL
jgi:hypothetical protein